MSGKGTDSAPTTAQHQALLAALQNNADDLKLIDSLIEGERDALGLLYSRHAAIMLAVAFRILQNRRDAEDVVHDVFVEAWQKAHSFDSSRGSVRNWLLVRTRSRSIDRARISSRTQSDAIINTLQSTATMTSDESDSQIDRRRAVSALSTLSKDQRFVLELNYFSGISCREIAQQYDIPEGTVKSRLLAGIKQLKKHLASTVGDDI